VKSQPAGEWRPIDLGRDVPTTKEDVERPCGSSLVRRRRGFLQAFDVGHVFRAAGGPLVSQKRIAADESKPDVSRGERSQQIDKVRVHPA
jgi:hypothetical protein